MLRRIRIILACVFLAGITLLFFGIGADWWGWMAKLQFLPAVERSIGSATFLNLAVVSGIILLTLVFGRIYCSVICPLGVFQDVIIWLRRQFGLLSNKLYVRSLQKNKLKATNCSFQKDKLKATNCSLQKDKLKATNCSLQKNELRATNSGTSKSSGGQPVTLKPSVKHFAFSPERKIIRYGFLILAVAAMVAGIQVFISLIAPYSAYGRIIRGIAGITDGSPMPLIITACATLLVITACALLAGRIWCNTVCPVGTLLGLFSRFAIFKPHIDSSKCINCGRCVRGCKSSCIDGENHIIDYSRCVVCFDCIGRCKEGAISFGAPGPHNPTQKATATEATTAASAPKETKAAAKETKETKAAPKETKAAPKETEATAADPQTSVSRREFLSISALIAGGAIANAADNQGGLAPIIEKKCPERSGRIVPPGAQSVRNFYDRCTSCQLCVSSCPNGVLRPSTDLQHFLQPEAGYEKGYCRPECVECSQVCPTGAILPINRDEKTLIHIGTAKINLDLCINGCGNCARHCPTGAIRMVRIEGYRNPMPVVMEEVCIGCGACEYLCPSRPVSAITVDGLASHRIG